MHETSLSLRHAWLMTRRNLDVFLRTWKTNFLPPIIEPIFYLLAMGYGLGALIETVEGYEYAQFLAPGLIAITAMQTAFFETTYSSYVRMFFQKTWDAVRATPLSEDDILLGEVLWAAIRAAINSTLMTLVVFAFGYIEGPEALLVPLVSFVGALIFAGIGLGITGIVPSIDQFSYAMYLFITPLFLFAGTFFPLQQLPPGVIHLALALPLTHLVAVTRYLTIGYETGYELYSAVYLVVFAVLAPMVGMRICRKKISR